MAEIESRHISAVYYAPTANRRFIHVKSAAAAEARAMMSKKYKKEYLDGEGYSPYLYWEWRNDAHLQRVCERLSRMILHRFNSRRD